MRKNENTGNKCIMPEMPYCPACEYGMIIYPEDADNIYDVDPEWVCLLKNISKKESNDNEVSNM